MTNIIEAGDLIPALTLPDLKGRPIALDSYRGKKLLLFMWASW